MASCNMAARIVYKVRVKCHKRATVGAILRLLNMLAFKSIHETTVDVNKSSNFTFLQATQPRVPTTGNKATVTLVRTAARV